MIRVSIIVPAWNAETTIRRCMDSLVNQTLKNIEIIAIDDGSTDKTYDILKEYEEDYDNVKCFTQEDLGQAYTVNRGWDMASGEYIAECDSDDYVDQDMYRILYEKATQHDADVIKCNYWAFKDNSMQRVYAYGYPGDDMYEGRVMNVIDIDYRLKNLIFGHPPTIFCGIYRREFMMKNMLKYREHTTFEDTSLMFRISCSAERFMYINDFLYFYNVGNPNSGTATIKNNEGIIEQFEEIKRFCEEKDLRIKPWVTVYAWYCFMWANKRIVKLEEKKAFILRCGEYLRGLPFDGSLFNLKEDADACMFVRGLK